MDEDDFDLGGFDEAYSPEDFSQADRDFATAVGMQTAGRGSESDSAAQFIANQFAKPQAGMSRSNVRGMENYDPTFAAALNISRGLDPTNNMGGVGGLAVPSYLRPQIEGERGPLAPKYYSDVERFAQETLPPMIQSAQKLGIGGLLDSIMGTFTDAKNALGKMGDAMGGISLPDLTGIFSTQTGQKAVNDMADNVAFDESGNRIDLTDTRQIADFQQPMGRTQLDLVKNIINQRAMDQRNFQTGYDEDPLIDLQPSRVQEVQPYGIFRDQLGRPQLGFRPTFQT